jgi:molybdopterin-containing oxidoreductase family iron-sulfur binding subunit
LFGASIALAGLSGCGQRPRERILPYVRSPRGLKPGVAVQYATSMVTDGFAVGLLARSNEGRPTKIEGNPEHPASLGASGVFEQASVLSLYDPARLRAPLEHGLPASWEAALAARPLDREARLWFVLYPQSSPLLTSWLDRLRQRYPRARFCFDTPLSRRSIYGASAAVFGRPLEAQYDFTRAKVVCSLDADFLASGPMALRWAHDFSATRQVPTPATEMSRSYQLEPWLTPTGSIADHRRAVQARQIPSLAAALLREVVTALPGRAGAVGPLAASLPEAGGTEHVAFLRALARDLVRARGDSIVIAGEQQPIETHVLAHALNEVLGNVGRSVRMTESALVSPLGEGTLAELVQAIQAHEVDGVVIVDANPVYTAPPELELERWLRTVSSTWHLSYYQNETSRACRWALPLSHYLESWGDARAYDGTLTYVQPLIEPLYPARSAVEMLAAYAGEPDARGYRLLTDHYRAALGSRFEGEWDERIRRGLTNGEAPEVRVQPSFARALEQARPALTPCVGGGLELALRPSPALHDGRFANNAWLLELPDPITKQCWGNAAVLAPKTAQALGVETGRVLTLTARGHTLRLPAIVLPGHAEGSVGVALGFGREQPDSIAHGVGVNAFPLAGEERCGVPVELARTDATENLALTQRTDTTHERPIAPLTSLLEYRADPQAITRDSKGPEPTLLPLYKGSPSPSGVQWAMTIDTTLCTGCSACVLACQAENNVPVVGKADVERSRHMHWLRIDRYFVEAHAETRVVQQPMLCQHCEAAPCEYVCPVNATVHSPDGLNEMVYNRCIGTRFCSNNCPYKVRRFNWFEYSEGNDSLALQRNPDVTVRERGVMEKCTYCVQRIRKEERSARAEGRPLDPSEVVTACQQSCSTQAIQFGSLGDAKSRMAQWRAQPRSYSVLHELNTRPRTQYLAKLVNVEPELGV